MKGIYLFVVFAWPIAALWASDAPSYKTFKDFEKGHPAERFHDKPTLEFDGAELFSIDATYVGDHVPLKDETKSFLKLFAKSRADSEAVLNFVNAYTEEVRVKTGSQETWLLMQRELMEFFLKEVNKGSKARFKIRYLGHSNTVRMYAVVEFQALQFKSTQGSAVTPPQEARVQLALVLPKKWEKVDQKQTENLRAIQLAIPKKSPGGNAKFESSLLYVQYRRTGPEVNSKALFESTQAKIKSARCFSEPIEIAHRAKNLPSKKVPEILGFLYACPQPGMSGFQAFLNVDDQTVVQFSLERPQFPISGEERDEYIGWLNQHLLSCLSADKDCINAADPMVKAAGADPMILLNPTFADSAEAKSSAN